MAAESVQDARAAVEFLTAELPAAERERARAMLLADIEALYALPGGPPPPEWLDLLKECFAGRAHYAHPPAEAG